MQKQSYFITGTDTDVGKTYIAAGLVRHFVQAGVKTIGMKPIAAGYTNQADILVNEDVKQLTAASNVTAPLHIITPYAFELAIAPHIAAQKSGATIEIDVIWQAYQQLSQMAEIVIVEGAGGFCVPLNLNQPQYKSMADLAVKLNLPVILVVGMRLGCINHALLTVQAIQAYGLYLAGWVANQVNGEMVAYQENFSTLKKLIPAPCLAEVKWGSLPVFD